MADDLGMSVSGFVKNKTLGIKTRHPKIAKSEALVIASELRRIGVNINQVAKHLNSGGDVSSGLRTQLKGIQEGLGEIWRMLS